MQKFARAISRVAAWLEQIVRVVSMLGVGFLICMVFLQVARRTLTGKSIVEIEELSIVLASWVAFLTISYAVRKRVHVRIDVLTAKLPFRVQYVLELLIQVAIFVMAIVLVVFGWQLAQNKMMVPMTVLPINSIWWYISYPVGMSFTCFFLFDNVVQELATVVTGQDPREPSQEEG